MVLNAKQKQELAESQERYRFPKKDEGEQLAIITKMHGTDQIKAICADGVERGCRITGKMKKRVWMRENDLIIVKVWDFQPSKADVMWRYLGNAKEFFKRKGMTGKLPI